MATTSKSGSCRDLNLRKSISSGECRSPFFVDLDGLLKENESEKRDTPEQLRLRDLLLHSETPVALHQLSSHGRLTTAPKPHTQMRVRDSNRLRPMKVVGGHDDNDVKYSTTLPESRYKECSDIVKLLDLQEKQFKRLMKKAGMDHEACFTVPSNDAEDGDETAAGHEVHKIYCSEDYRLPQYSGYPIKTNPAGSAKDFQCSQQGSATSQGGRAPDLNPEESSANDSQFTGKTSAGRLNQATTRLYYIPKSSISPNNAKSGKNQGVPSMFTRRGLSGSCCGCSEARCKHPKRNQDKQMVEISTLTVPGSIEPSKSMRDAAKRRESSKMHEKFINRQC